MGARDTIAAALAPAPPHLDDAPRLRERQADPATRAALAGLFSRDGRERRGALSAADKWVDEKLSYFLGPGARPVKAAADVAALFSPAMDVQDAYQASGELMAPGRSAWDRAASGAALAGSVAAMFMPGGVSSIRRGVEELVDAAVRAYDPAVLRSVGGNTAEVAGETPAQEVARLLREGRADSVTDDLYAQADPLELHRLYESGATGADMPITEAMQRADEGGFDTKAYHATRATEDFAAFRPGARGSVYMAATPESAMRGAAGQALENPYAPPGSQSVTATLPLMVRSSDIDGLSVNSEAWSALPEVVDGDEALRALQPQIEGVGAKYWDDVYLSLPRGDGFRYYRNDPPVVSYADLEPGRDVFGYRLPGWNSGSDVPSLNARVEKGQSGFLVADEAGSSIVASPAMPIRSKFARFDPRLKHLRNLSAGAAGAAALGSYANSQDDDEALIRAYLGGT